MISAIIVTYNPDIELLKKQYLILLEQVDLIIYVDNASSNINRMLHLLDSNKTLIILNEKNLGLGKAQNIALMKAIELKMDFVLLMDQDSIPSSNFVSNLMHTYYKCSNNCKVALVGPAIRNLYKGASCDEPGIIFKGVFIKRIKLAPITFVDYCIASGSLVAVHALSGIGLIQEELFIDGMDLEWSLRAKSKGYQIIQTNSAFLEHQLGNGKANKVLSHSIVREYYITRNDIWISKQNYIPVGYRIRKKITPFMRLLNSLFLFRSKYAIAEIKGIIDGLKM